MTLKQSMRDRIASIHPSRTLNLSKQPKFSPPLSSLEQDQSEDHPQGTNSTQGQNSNQDSELTQVENRPQGQFETYEKDTTVANDELPETTEIELENGGSEEKFLKTLDRLKLGSSYFSNNLLMELITGDYSKAEIKVALLVARFTYGFKGRTSASLSKRVIEKYTGLKGSTVLEAEKSLESKKIIKKTSGDKLTPSRLEMTLPIRPWTGPDFSKPSKKTPSKKSLQAESRPQGRESDNPQGSFGAHPSGTNLNHPQGQKSDHFIEVVSYKNLKSYLSRGNAVPEELNERWMNLVEKNAGAQVERETKIFAELFNTFGEEFRTHCANVVAFLESQGTKRAGKQEKVGNGMFFIENYWDKNLELYRAWEAEKAAQARIQANTEETERKKDQQIKELSQSLAHSEQLLHHLLNAFPDKTTLTEVARQAVAASGISSLLSSWNRKGWESPQVQNYVVHLFEKSPETLFRFAHLSTESNGFLSQEVSA